MGIIGGSAVAALLVILLVVVFIWPRPFAGNKENGSRNGEISDSGGVISSSAEFSRRQSQLETLSEILKRERESLDILSQELKEQEVKMEENRKGLEREKADLKQEQGKLGNNQIVLE